MNDPRRWTASELARDVEQAKTEFRRRRLHEPLDVYSRFFRTFLEAAQGEGLAVIWSHRLEDLAAFIESSRD